jgi:hypothetical protein
VGEVLFTGVVNFLSVETIGLLQATSSIAPREAGCQIEYIDVFLRGMFHHGLLTTNHSEIEWFRRGIGWHSAFINTITATLMTKECTR